MRHLIILRYNIDPEKDAKLFEQLKEEIGDIVYSCETYDDAEVLLIAHSEHQSTPDKHYPLRNALYNISALKDFIETEKPDKYPLVVSFLAYHGKPSPYPYPTDIIENFEHRELAQKYFLKPVLIDYRQSDDEDLLEHGEISGLEIALKHTFDERVDDNVIKNLMHGLKKCTKIELRHDWWMYALKSWETSADTMIKEYKETLNEEENFVMTAAQQLIEKGIEKGAFLKAQETAANFLRMGISVNKVIEGTGLDKKTVIELQKSLIKN